jgi:hypothetical protein
VAAFITRSGLLSRCASAEEMAESRGGEMPCDKYRDAKTSHDSSMSTWAQYTYRENRHLQGGVGPRNAKEIAKEARTRAAERVKEMQWHRDHCEECKRVGGDF